MRGALQVTHSKFSKTFFPPALSLYSLAGAIIFFPWRVPLKGSQSRQKM